MELTVYWKEKTDNQTKENRIITVICSVGSSEGQFDQISEVKESLL